MRGSSGASSPGAAGLDLDDGTPVDPRVLRHLEDELAAAGHRVDRGLDDAEEGAAQRRAIHRDERHRRAAVDGELDARREGRLQLRGDLARDLGRGVVLAADAARVEPLAQLAREADRSRRHLVDRAELGVGGRARMLATGTRDDPRELEEGDRQRVEGGQDVGLDERRHQLAERRRVAFGRRHHEPPVKCDGAGSAFMRGYSARDVPPRSATIPAIARGARPKREPRVRDPNARSLRRARDVCPSPTASSARSRASGRRVSASRRRARACG